MRSHHKNFKAQNADPQPALSRDMAPLPENFGPVFFKNQFRTRIELPTKEKYPDVQGECAIVTGSNTGLGFESAKQLLALGLSHLVMGVRSLEKGKDSIQTFVQKCQANLSLIDMVILNAGLAPLVFTTIPATGHEKTIQVNHISTVLHAITSIPVLKSKTDGKNVPRLTIVNSVTAHLCKFPNKDKRPLLAPFDNTAITPWDPEERYGVSKLLCQLFIVKLAEHVDSDVIINMVDPGLTKGTALARDTKGAIAVAAKLIFTVAGRPVAAGAATYVDAALGHGKESHGCFLMNWNISP
ncbi:hypothetical protein QQZ08_001210 [Neonectria magnoliae]|uniref:Uncharacterized protein n=1 Tax=Neonectria magnoliae TaxID=2732573 RepID=A0ABR1IGD3_9HYPO